MNCNRIFVLGVAFLLMTVYSCKPVAQLPVADSFKWLEGTWLGSGGDEGETWNYIAAEDRMEGMAWKMVDGDTVTSESMQVLYRRDKLFYMAQPNDQGPVYFEVTEHGSDFFRASNPFHDFPNTIEYQREGAQLKARISSEEQEKEFSFIKQ